MTLSEIATYITGKVGQIDATSVALCKTFIKRRYQLIWDSHPWRDAQITASTSVTAGTSSVAMPASMERVIAIQANLRFLDPVDSTYLIQTDPGIFTRSGTPEVYEEWTDAAASDAKKIKVFPTPTVNTTLFIVGKRTRPELTDSTSSIIRNIDNALIAYATGDMLERQRQYAKAQSKFQEASTLLEAAKAIETGQANRPRRAKNLTVSGNSLAELTDSVCARVGAWELDNVILVKDLVKRNYQAVYDRELWRESLVVATVESDGEEVVLPEYIDRVVAVRADANLGELIPVDTGLLFGIAPNIFEQSTGTQVAYSTLAPVGVKVLPPGNERLSLVSTIGSDKGAVFIRGESAGAEVTEEVTMAGTTPVQTVFTYDTPLTIAKGATVGTVIMTGATSTVELQRLLPNETERKHIRLWLHPQNAAGTACLILGKRRIQPLQSDEDTPMLRDIQGVIIEMTVADMLTRAGNAKGATEARAKAKDALQSLINLETRQGAAAPRVIPSIEPMAYDMNYLGSWIVAK